MNLSLHKPPTMKAPWLEDGLNFAAECLIARGHGFVRGTSGTGKTHLGEFIQTKWDNRSYPGECYVFRCPAERTVERVAEKLLRHMLESIPPLPQFPSLDDISRLILNHCAQKGGGFLFVDGAQILSQDGISFFTSLLDMAQDENVPLGMLFSIHNPKASFYEAENSPNCLGSIALRSLNRSEMMACLALWFPEFQKTCEAYLASEKEALVIATLILNETKGNFERLVGLWRSAKNLGVQHLTSAEGLSALFKRRHPEKFTLVADPPKSA